MSYQSVGGRGVQVCNGWRDNFTTFRNWAMSNGWRQDDGLILERVDDCGDYTSDNCYFGSIAKLCLIDFRAHTSVYDGL